MNVRVGVFAGSSAFAAERYEAGAERLRALGVELVEAPGLRAREGFLAGPDADRATGLSALASQPLDAIIAARGGYGLTRILGALEPERFRTPVVGFSDVSALHLLLQGHGLGSIHGPVVTQLPALPDADVERLLGLVQGLPPEPLCADGPVLAPGAVSAPLWGGNLAVLCALLGTRHLRLPEQPILLLLEDVGEATFRLDRYLTQLVDSDLWSRVAGVVVGDFVDCRPGQPDHPTVEAVLAERLGRRAVPVLCGFPIGHGARNAAVPLGVPAHLDTAARTLSW